MNEDLRQKLKQIVDPQGVALDKANQKIEELKAKLDEPVKVELPEKKINDPSNFVTNLLGVLDSIRGDKGEVGDSPTEEELLKIIKPLIPEPVQGEPGKDADENAIANKVIPIILDKIPTKEEIVKSIPKPQDGKPGKDAKPTDIDKIVEKILPLIPKPKDGVDADPETVIEALKNLPEKKKLDISHLRNSVQIQSAIAKMIKGGGITGVNTNKITVSVATPENPKDGDLWVSL